MTPSEIETAARRAYNGEGDDFWSSAEIMDLIYAASLELSIESLAIERTFTTTSVLSQRSYSLPTETISVKRIEYNGAKLQPTTFREDDAITLSNSNSTDSGTPQYYMVWNEAFFLRPIPDTTGTEIKIYSINQPQRITTSSTMEIPTRYHLDIVKFLLREMYSKDKNLQQSSYYTGLWEQAKLRARKWEAKRKRGDSNAVVQDVENIPTTVLGLL